MDTTTLYHTFGFTFHYDNASYDELVGLQETGAGLFAMAMSTCKSSDARRNGKSSGSSSIITQVERTNMHAVTNQFSQS